MTFRAAVQAKAIDLTRESIEMTAAAGSGHPTSAASLAHLVTVLVFDHMRFDPDWPDDPKADRLVLSEGHACPIVYAAGADIGVAIGREGRRRMTHADALELRAIGSPIDGHPNPVEGFPFFPAATGSLGQGLSIAAGLALAARLDGFDKRIFCLIGDGEAREGQIWEAVDFIVERRLRAVCPIFNCNALGQIGPVSEQQSPERLSAKLGAAGVESWIIDGHDPLEIRAALDHHSRVAGNEAARPFAILARTIKGWGFPSGQGEGFHGKAFVGHDRELALAELDNTAREVGARHFAGELRRPPLSSEVRPARRPRPGKLPANLREALEGLGRAGSLEQGKLATRKAYGVALRMLGHADPNVVVLDAGVSNSTCAEEFANDPELAERFFECRIAEQNMVSCAAGMARAGKLPFVSTFGKFATRAYDQMEMAIVSHCNLKLVGSHTGVSLAADGPSQMALPDVAFFHAFATLRDSAGEPVLYLLNPADAYAAYALTLAMAAHDGPCYLRTHRPDVPLIYGDEATSFALGGHHVLRGGHDVLLVASGYLVHETLAACEELQRHGIDPTVVDLYSLPFDEAALVDLARANTGNVVTVEDNYGGGFGSAVAEAITHHGLPAVVRQVHVRKIPKSGREPHDLLEDLSLTAADITRTAMVMLKELER